MQTVRWRKFCRTSSGLCVMVVLCLLGAGGCKNRQLTKPTIQMDIEPRFWMRVLLLDDVNSCTLTSASPLRVSQGPIVPKARSTGIRLGRADAPIKVELIDGAICVAGKKFQSNEIVLLSDTPHIFNLNGNDYRGDLRLIVNPDGCSFDAINLVPPEPYLAGVVGAEMPKYWETEALKAQAIAARTYCFYIKQTFGVNRNWDVKQTAANQVYRGLAAESARVWKAVNQTKGRVLTCKQPGGSGKIFPTYYSSTCGGHTESSKNVFGDSFEPLVGVPCPYCQIVAQPKHFFWPMVRLDKTEVADRLFRKYPALKRLGKIASISATSQSNYADMSRLTKIEIRGSNGNRDFLRAEDFRLTVDPTGRKLKSSICRIVDWNNYWAFLSGRGWGHGVGMCQYGAQGMAREGYSVAQILSHYYPTSTIETIYR